MRDHPTSTTTTNPPGPPPPSKSVAATPRLYLTPQLTKRKDGLCPSLLHQVVINDKPGFVSKPYQTNSSLLLQIKTREGVAKEVSELQTIVECVNKALKSSSASSKQQQSESSNSSSIASVSFKPEGCLWKVTFDPATGAARTYKMEVSCSANGGGGSGVTNYLVNTVLVPRVPIDPNPLATPLEGFAEAKEVFDALALKVRKSIVRLEFPSFPEGCKSVAFRDVYQLNARVRYCLFCIWL